MAEQVIISVGREFGSGGHEIANMLAERFDLPVYDRVLLKEIAAEKNMEIKVLEKYDEHPKKHLFSRTVRGHSNSPEEIIANMQFDFLRKKAESGESFVVVGRCAETVLKEYKGLIAIFVSGDMECKIRRTMEVDKLSERDAKILLERRDKKRRTYHNSHCKMKWGDSRNYDVCINSSKLGLEETANILEEYIKKWLR